MSQVWTMARADWRRLRREPGSLATPIAVTLLLTVAIVVGVTRERAAWTTTGMLQTRLDTTDAEVQRRAGQPPADDGIAAWDARNPDFVANDRGTLAIAAPAPLLALSVGQTDLHPSQVKVTGTARADATPAVEIAHPLALALGPFDADFVIVFLWPLAVIAACFDLLGGDRERGPVRMLVAQPVTAGALVGGPLLARGAFLGAAVLAPLLLLPLVVADDGRARLVLWAATVLAYGGFWAGLAVWVASRGRPAVANAVWLGAAWLLLVVVVPGAVTLAITSWGRVPSGVAFADATRAATSDALSDGSRVLGHFLEDHPTASAVGRDGLRQYALLQAARDQEVRRRLAPVIDRYEAALAAQRRVADMARFASPALLAADALQHSAGTSRTRAVAFRGQVDAFRARWRAFFEPRILAGVSLTVADAAAVPRFVFEEPAPSTVVAALWLPLAALVTSGALMGVRGLVNVQAWANGRRG